MPHNHTKSFVELINALGKKKVNSLSNAVVNMMDEENDYKNVVVSAEKMNETYEALKAQGAEGNVLGAVLTAKPTMYDIFQQLKSVSVSSEELKIVLNVLQGSGGGAG